MRERPSYYAVIPANVRYAKGLSANAKLLYGEITALCSKEGYCWAGNQYFAGLYDTTARTARNWINELKEGGYITLEYKYVEGTREIETRHIRLVEGGGEKKDPTCRGEAPAVRLPPVVSAAEEAESAPIPACNSAASGEAAEGGGEKNNPTYGKNFPEVWKKTTGGGEENAPHNITSNNINKESSSSGSGSPGSGTEKEEEEAVVNKTQNKDMRKLFLDLDKRFVFDELFYVNAVRFLEDKGLPDEYLSWLYEECKKQKPRILVNYYYKLFFSSQMAELYKGEEKDTGTAKQSWASCPVCGEMVNAAETVCPRCRFETRYRNDKQKIAESVESERKRSAEIDRLRKSALGTTQLIKSIAEMNKRSSA
jgi:hypothetical protein